MEQDVGGREADPRFLARPWHEGGWRSYPGDGEQARVVRGSALGLLDQAAWGYPGGCQWAGLAGEAGPEK